MHYVAGKANHGGISTILNLNDFDFSQNFGFFFWINLVLTRRYLVVCFLLVYELGAP
jgi:hypothetical protein